MEQPAWHKVKCLERFVEEEALTQQNFLATVAGQDQFTNSGRDERRREKYNTLTNIVSNYHLVTQDDYLKSLASELAKLDKYPILYYKYNVNIFENII